MLHAEAYAVHVHNDWDIAAARANRNQEKIGARDKHWERLLKTNSTSFEKSLEDFSQLSGAQGYVAFASKKSSYSEQYFKVVGAIELGRCPEDTHHR